MADPFGKTWWGRKWWRSLETLGLNFPDPRITKGRAIATRGDVEELNFEPGRVSGAVIDGTTVCQTDITIPIYDEAAWTRGIFALTTSPSSVAALLSGTLSKKSEKVLASVDIQLIPKKNIVAEKDQLRSHCTCDEIRPVCGHAMALALVSASKLDDDASLILRLRGAKVENLPARLRAARVATMDAAEAV